MASSRQYTGNVSKTDSIVDLHNSRTREGCWNIKGSLYSVHYPVTVAPKSGVAGENRVTGDNRVAGENMGAVENGVAGEKRVAGENSVAGENKVSIVLCDVIMRELIRRVRY